MERFKTHIGHNIDPLYICELSTEELAAKIRSLTEWEPDLLRDLCWRADMIDEWEAADDITFESVAYAAAKKLNVEI